MDYTELLPPLPAPFNPSDAWMGDDGDLHEEATFSTEQMCAYALAAIAAAAPAIRREERERCAKVCDVTPPEPFRPSIEAAHAIRALPEEP